MGWNSQLTLYKKSDVSCFYFQDLKTQIKMSVEICNGRVFVEGVETINPELIGWAIIDFAESQEKDGMKIVLKEQDVFVESLIREL